MYFHQPIVYFFFGNNASVIVLTKALGFSMCLGIFLQLSNWVRSGHRAMFVQCSYNGKKKVRTMFVQCPTKLRTILYELLFCHCTNIVRTLCVPSCTSTFDGISKKTPADRPTHLTGILLSVRFYTWYCNCLFCIGIPLARPDVCAVHSSKCIILSISLPSDASKAKTTRLFWYNLKPVTTL